LSKKAKRNKKTSQTKIELPYYSAIPLLGIYPKGMQCIREMPTELC
jgi:hypothetical protein